MSDEAGRVSGRVFSKDFVTGLLFGATGLSFAIMGADYGIGSARRMGPGYFPVAIGAALALVGLALILKATLSGQVGDATPRIHLRPLFFLTASVFAFAIAIDRFGLIAACVSCVLLAGAAGRVTRWRETVVVAVAMAFFSSLVFVEFLGLPMRLWRW